MGEYRSSDDDYDYDYDYYDDDDEVDFVDDDENGAELEAAVEPEIPPNSCPSSKVRCRTYLNNYKQKEKKNLQFHGNRNFLVY